MTGARSRRQKKYVFSVHQKKGADWKQTLADKVRQNVNEFQRMIVFKVVNPRTDLMQDLRKKFRGSVFLMGKNKVLQIGLGRTEKDEFAENIHKISELLVGQRGILFTNDSVDSVLSFFNEHSVMVHSRSGSDAPKTVTLQPGLLTQFTFKQEPLLRTLGLVTRLTLVGAGAGTPELLVPFRVSTKGKPLKPKKATMLKLLGHKDSKFHVRLYGVWERESEMFSKFGLKDDQMVLKGRINEEEDSDDEIDDMTTDEEVSEDENEVDDMEL